MSGKSFNAENDRIKRAYFIYLKKAQRQSEASTEKAAATIDAFQDYTRHTSLM